MEFGIAHSSKFQHHNTCNLINPLDEPEGQLAVAILSNVFGGWTTLLLLRQPVATLFAWASNERFSRRQRMYRVRQEKLTVVESSHQFVGAEQGGGGLPVCLFN